MLSIHRRTGFRNAVKTACLLVLACLLFHVAARSQTTGKTTSFTHHIGIAYRPAWVIPSPPFYNVDFTPDLSFGFAQSGHLTYGFALPEGSLGSQAFPSTQQGIGIAAYGFGDRRQLGSPIAAYLFQTSRIARISARVSLDYEWNFGLSTRWNPYHPEHNPNNIIVGSTTNAYISLGASLRWRVAKRIAMSGGVDFTHFSNGNTEYPNAGINMPGIKIGLTYDVSKNAAEPSEAGEVLAPVFPRHFSYDLVVFGSWRRKGVDFFGLQVASPFKYPVVGAYFAPMYNWGHRFRTGISLDAIYDGSANVYTADYIIGTEQVFFKPDWQRQAALGLSARADYVMPIFTIGIGIGTHVLHQGGDLSGTYQAFALKVSATKNTFIHIGYNLKDFQDPNYLMLGVGYRFNNRTPSLLSR